MDIAIVTGSSGLVGCESVNFLTNKFSKIVGIDNDFRKYFFGSESSNLTNTENLVSRFQNFSHNSIDIRNYTDLESVFLQYNTDIKLIIHCASQPSHDWSAKEPLTDFTINAIGTLNLLELIRLICPKAVFIYVSTNKVYGDIPNKLPLFELPTRWEIDRNHDYFNGISENMPIDNCIHSLFGVSKTAGDLLTQEYGKNFGLNTGIFRCGCISGSKHSGAELHGFLSYLVRCFINKKEYSIFGYKGKQVRDNIHSSDLVNAFWQFYQSPRKGEIYNLGGSRTSNCSVLEAIQILEDETNIKLSYNILDTTRIGDHIWWITDNAKFINHYPNWNIKYDIKKIIKDILNRVC